MFVLLKKKNFVVFFFWLLKKKVSFFRLKKKGFLFSFYSYDIFFILLFMGFMRYQQTNWLEILIPIGFKFYMKWNSTYIYIYILFEVKFIPICKCLNPMTGMHSFFFIIIFSFYLSYFSLTSKNLIKTSHIHFNPIHNIKLLYSFILFYNNWFKF